MKDKLLYLTIGMLVAIVVMQWTMPEGQATIVTAPVGGIVALMDPYVVLANGEMWSHDQFGNWVQRSAHFNLPVPATDVQFIDSQTSAGLIKLVTKSGDVWGINYTEDFWVNYGPVPSFQTPTHQKTIGGVKGQYKGKKD